MRIEIGQIIGQIISFLIMLWVMKRYAWKPFLSVLDERKNKIKSEFDTIDAKTKELDQLSKEYQTKINEIESYAKQRTKEAIDLGEKKASQIEGDALSEAKAILAKAQDDMQKEIEKAKVQLKDEVVNLTVLATSKVLASSVDKDKQNHLVKDFINTMEQK